MTPQQLYAIRQELGWSQTATAKYLGVEVRTYRYYEEGKNAHGTTYPHVPQAVGLAMLGLRFARDVAAVTGDALPALQPAGRANRSSRVAAA